MVAMVAMEWKWNRYGDIIHLVPIVTEVGVCCGRRNRSVLQRTSVPSIVK